MFYQEEYPLNVVFISMHCLIIFIILYIAWLGIKNRIKGLVCDKSKSSILRKIRIEWSSMRCLDAPTCLILINPMIISICLLISNYYESMALCCIVISELYAGFSILMFYRMTKYVLYFMNSIKTISEMYNLQTCDTDRNIKNLNASQKNFAVFPEGRKTDTILLPSVRDYGVSNYAVFGLCNKPDLKYNTTRKKQDKRNFSGRIISEQHLLNANLRGVNIPHYDSFDSLIDNPYIPYCPPKLTSLSESSKDSHDNEEDLMIRKE